MIRGTFQPVESSSSVLFDDESSPALSFGGMLNWSDDEEDHQMERTILRPHSIRSFAKEVVVNYDTNNNNGGQDHDLRRKTHSNNNVIENCQHNCTTLANRDFDSWDVNDAHANCMLRLLPPEMCFLILTFVDFETLLNCQLVSKEWYQFTNSCDIWSPFYHLKGYSPRNSFDESQGVTNRLTMNEFTIFDKDGGVVNPRQKHLSEEYLSWMLQERDYDESPKSEPGSGYRSLFLYKASQRFEKKTRKNELIEMYYSLNRLVTYLPTLKRVSYWCFSIGILIFSILFPLLMDDEGKFKNIENLGFYYLIYVFVCYGPVFIGHASCLVLCYWVYRKHVNLSYHDQSERLLIFSMTNATSYLLDVTFETQLLCSVPFTFCIPIFMRIFDWGHTVSMFPLLTTIMAQKCFYFVYEVQREKILKRKKWETLRAVNTVLLFQVALICFKLDKMLVLRYVFGDIVMGLNWRMIFIPAHIFGFIYCMTNIHALQIKKHFFSMQRNEAITRKCVMFGACLAFYLFFFYLLGLKLDMADNLDYSFLYIFVYWYVVGLIYVLLKQERIRSHLM